MKITCGIDWAEKHHDIALVDENGALIAKQRISETVDGFNELLTMLAEAGDSPQTPIPVAIETPRGLLVAALRAAGRKIYPINPMAVARYRERHSASGKKSDHADAMVLANILRTDAHVHRPLPADTELVRSIKVLARACQDATWRRTRAGNEPRSLLREYYPAMLEAAANRSGSLATPLTRALLQLAPTPAAAVKVSQVKIAAALRRAGRLRHVEEVAAELHAIFRRPHLRQDPLVEQAMGAPVSAASPTKPARGSWPRSATIAPASPVPDPSKRSSDQPRSPGPPAAASRSPAAESKTPDSRPSASPGAYPHSISRPELVPTTTGDEPQATDTPPPSATCSTASSAASITASTSVCATARHSPSHPPSQPRLDSYVHRMSCPRRSSRQHWKGLSIGPTVQAALTSCTARQRR
ncbi:transposase [Nonomuraea dietziae]|uniref:Transposase n=1 Tax=Nonomuraea dietziae TaxID=65515 RepID=A0A7W5VBR3_9ACTN|nr:transposase [Nonomuraea dietziae]